MTSLKDIISSWYRPDTHIVAYMGQHRRYFQSTLSRKSLNFNKPITHKYTMDEAVFPSICLAVIFSWPYESVKQILTPHIRFAKVTTVYYLYINSTFALSEPDSTLETFRIKKGKKSEIL